MSTSLSYLKRSIRSTTPPAHDSKRRKMPMYTRVVQVDDHQPSLKRERSPTPLPLNTPRTSGTVHASIPDACRKSTPGWQASREKWVAEETRKLKALGLVIEKRLIRDDGLAIDWISQRAVDPYTLRPVSPPPPPTLPESDNVSPETVHSIIDPLGHALHDQTATAREHAKPPDTPAQLLDRRPPSPLAAAQSTASTSSAQFVVVGAASQKENIRHDTEEVSGTSGDWEVQKEHRRLLPSEFRGGKYLKDWALKERRKEWIQREIEKVEGYTGEKIQQFRYDNDDVVLMIGKPKSKPNTNDHLQKGHTRQHQNRRYQTQDKGRNDFHRTSMPEQHSGAGWKPRWQNQSHAGRGGARIDLPRDSGWGRSGRSESQHSRNNYAPYPNPSLRRGPHGGDRGHPMHTTRVTPSNSRTQESSHNCTPTTIVTPLVPPSHSSNPTPPPLPPFNLSHPTPPPPSTPPSHPPHPTPSSHPHPSGPEYSTSTFRPSSSSSLQQPLSPPLRLPTPPPPADQFAFPRPSSFASGPPRPPSAPSKPPPITQDSSLIQLEPVQMPPSPKDEAARYEQLRPPASARTPTPKESSAPVSDLSSTGNVAEHTLVVSPEDAQEWGLAFLEQYMHAFDNYRQSLLDAYTPRATFTLTEDDKPSAQGHQHINVTSTGPTAIVKTLQTIDSNVRHSSAITYTITCLDDMSPGGLLLNCQGSLIPIIGAQNQSGRLFFSRIFVVMQNQGASRNTWPLQIVLDTLNLTRQRR